MKNIMNKANLSNAKELVKKEALYIKDYLRRLQDVEASIINVDQGIASGNFGCYHYRPCALFHNMQPYAPYVKTELEYTIQSYEEDGIKIEVDSTPLLIPYAFSEKEFFSSCESLFMGIKEKMRRCFKRKAEAEKEYAIIEGNDKRIREPHTFGDYTYRWIECNNNKCHYGKVAVGTGKFEDDPYSYADSPGIREIFIQKNCPKCQGTSGLLIYEKNGLEMEKPCSKWFFEQNENDFMELLSNV